MHRSLRAAARLSALVAGLTMAVTGVAAAHASPRFDRNPVVGHVYVNDNTAPVNTIAGFDRHADGTLTPIPGSPFATSGAGTGKQEVSQTLVRAVRADIQASRSAPGTGRLR